VIGRTPGLAKRQWGAVLRAFPEVRLAVLFGSWARGDALPGSDIDVAVLGAEASLLEIAEALTEATGREVDVVSIRDPSIPLAEELIRDGLPLYEREPGTFAEWRSHLLISLETDRPWFARMRDAWISRVGREGL